MPLGFLLALLAIALFVQSRNAVEAAQSGRLTQIITTSDQAATLLDKASRSVLAYDKGHDSRALRPYDEVRVQLPATLAALRRLQVRDPAGIAAEQRLSRALTAGLGVITQYLGYARAQDAAAKARLTSSARVNALSQEISAARIAFNELERSLTIKRLNQVRREISILTAGLIVVSILGILVTVLLSLRFSLRMTLRISQLAENARRLSQGEQADAIEGSDEIAELDVVYRAMMERTKREHDAVVMLQRALLPQHLPQVSGVRLDAAYVPAYGGAEIGGDWYDVFSISDRLLGISVGDVAGHGLRAATVMGQARQALRTASYADDDPATVLDHVNRLFCRSEEDVLMSAFYGTLDLADGNLRYALAGHPPPMVVVPGASVRSLPGHGLLLGFEVGERFRTFQTQLSEGSAVVFFTDGLVEAERDYVAGVRELSDAIEAEYREASQNIAQAIVQRIFAQRTPRDDVAVLVLAVIALGAALHTRRMSWTLDAGVERSARSVKRALLWQLSKMDANADLRAAEMIVGELMANVARHTPGTAEVVLERQDQNVVVRVRDRGEPFTPPDPSRQVEPLSENGRGLFLVQAVSSQLHVEPTGSGNTVSVVLPPLA
ncbi:MAG: serine/threonine-protein phosphatase [Candidatus Eremiobacteraeota bacterium]|nr:serine/threonine-protein phosphatase [Candidatus Eremiobacteraeota bacterium]